MIIGFVLEIIGTSLWTYLNVVIAILYYGDKDYKGLTKVSLGFIFIAWVWYEIYMSSPIQIIIIT